MPITRTVIAAVILSASSSAVSAQAPAGDERQRFTVLMRSLEALPVRLAEINENAVHVWDEAGELKRIARKDVLGLISDEVFIQRDPDTGEAVLADGQRLPGTSIQRSVENDDALLWLHQRLRQVMIPIDSLRTARFQPGAPLPEPGVADVLRLTNGDRIEGFITGIGEAISLDVNGTEASVPLDRVASIRLVAIGAAERASESLRIWLTDGTVMDVRAIGLGEDGVVRVEQPLLAPEITQQFHGLRDVAGILFDPEVLIPLASLDAPSISGPPTRYTTPAPVLLDDVAPLGLARLQLNGPLTARWRIPPGVTAFAAEAILPREAFRWGHCEVIVLDDDREVFRATLSRTTPRVKIQVPLAGSELTIRIDEGEYGPIQDRIVLERAALLRGGR